MFSITLTEIKELAPHAQGEYIAAFADVNSVLGKFGIAQSRGRTCHFFAQILAETGGFRVFEENLNYSAERLVTVWPRHFPNPQAAEPYAHNPEALGNFIYGKTSIANQLGNTEPGDGYRFRGRGFLQTTGRAAYKKYGELLGVPLLDNPNLAYNHDHSLSLASAEFSQSRYKGKTANNWSDEDNVVNVTFAVNGGQNGIDQRKLWLIPGLSD